MSDPSNADVTKESNNSGDGTSRDDTSEDDSFYIRDTNTHRDGTENNGTNSHLKDVHHNPSQSCDKRTNSNEGRELGKLDQGKQKGIQPLAETFENLRSHMSTAWNNAMV